MSSALAVAGLAAIIVVSAVWLLWRVAAARRSLPWSEPVEYRSTFDGLPDGLMLLDSDGLVVDLNPAAERALGLAASTAAGRALASLRPELAALGREPLLVGATDGVGGPIYEVRAHHLAGEGGVAVVLRDVTQALASEEALVRRAAVLAAIEEVSRSFLLEPSSATALDSLLSRLAQAVDAGRVVMLEKPNGAASDTPPHRSSHWQSLEARPWQADEPPYGPQLLGWARQGSGFTGPVGELPAADREALTALGVGYLAMMPVKAVDDVSRLLVLEWQAPVPGWLPLVVDTVRAAPAAIEATLLHRSGEEAGERSRRFEHSLLDLTRELLQQEVTPGFYDTLLARAVEVIPGAQAGSLLLRSGDGRFRVVAASGFELERLSRARFSETEVLPPRTDGSSESEREPLDGSDPSAADAPAGAGPTPRPRGAATADMPAVVRGSGLEHGVGAIRAQASNAATPPSATLIVPVTLRHVLQATLRLDNLEDAHAFGPDAVRMAEAFGLQVAALLQRVGLERRRDRAARMTALLADIERLLLVSDRLDSFFPLLARLVLDEDGLGLSRMAVLRSTEERVRPAVYDEQGRRDMEFEAKLGAHDGSALEPGPLRALVDPIGPVVCEDARAKDGSASASTPRDEAADGVGAWIAQPLSLRGVPWGVIAFFSARPMRFDPQLRETLEQVASSIELALLRQEDRERLELQLAKMSAVVRTNEALRGATRRRDAVGRALQAVLDMTRADLCELLLFDVELDGLRVIGQRRRGAEAVDRIEPTLGRGVGLSWKVFDAGTTSVLRDELGLAGAVPPAERDAAPVAYLGTPLRNREGAVVGVLAATIDEAQRRFEREDAGFLEAIALACGNALDRLALVDQSRAQAREYRSLYAAADRQARELTLLDRVRGAVAKELAIESLFATTVEATAEVLGYRMVDAYAVEGDILVLRHQVGHERALARVALGEGMLGRVAREGLAALASDTATDPDLASPEEGVRGEVAAPVISHGKVVAVLRAESVDRVLDEADLRLMSAVSEQLGVAVERAALYGAVRESEQRFRLLAEHMNDMVCLHRPDFTYEYVSPSSRTLLGYQPEDLVGLDPYAFIHELDREVVRAAGQQRLIEGQPFTQLTYRVRHADGHDVWIETAARPVLDDAGRVEGLVTVSRDVTERKHIEDRLVHDALYDSLTGLPNRVLLNDRLERALARAVRSDTARFAVLFLDLDRFKVINDSLGHNAGDELLRAFGTRLTSCVRDADTVARLGGDEFCVLIEELGSADHAIVTATRILRSLANGFNVGGHDIFTSASIGIAYSAAGYEEPQELLRDADIAMYRAKAAGKARYAVFDESMHAQAYSLMQLETSLHRAVERGELFLEYQPIFHLADQTLSGFEALVRWNHPDRGQVSPVDFIPLAEESGLIVSIDRWVLAEATRQLAAWQSEFADAGDLSVSVNVSARHLALADVATLFVETIADAGVRPTQVKLEITESALMGNPAVAAEVLAELRDHGVVVQVDDFGTGYSSLSYLHRLPISSLKIDRSFVRGIDAQDTNLQIVTTIVKLAHNLGIDVVAEGIETPVELDVLLALECDYGQGYYFARPLAANDVGAFLRSGRGGGRQLGRREMG